MAVLKKILVIDDEENILISLKGVLEDEGFSVETAKNGVTGLQKIKKFTCDIVLLDIWLPDEDGIRVLEKIKKFDSNIEVIMMSGHATVETAVKAIKLGAFDFLEKPIHYDKLFLLLQHVFELKDLQDENRYLKEELNEDDKLIGTSSSMIALKNLISLAAPSNGWVLIQGENGTGKELVAKALHAGSPRSKKRFVPVNCAAIPDELVESELFGHEKGSFTGAFDRKIGKFEQAHEGILFLDEVGDMSARMQAKILRALEETTIQRVGGADQIEVDIRVIAATNKDLKESIRKGEFRDDLFFRLSVIPLFVPPLRDRKEDISQLTEYFLKKFSGKSKRIHGETLKLIENYPWPGNVRELKNWVERACILTPGKTIAMDVSDISKETEILSIDEQTLRGARSSFEKQFILKMLSHNGGNISKTAQVIGVERSHLHKKIKSYGIGSEATS